MRCKPATVHRSAASVAHGSVHAPQQLKARSQGMSAALSGTTAYLLHCVGAGCLVGRPP